MTKDKSQNAIWMRLIGACIIIACMIFLQSGMLVHAAPADVNVTTSDFKVTIDGVEIREDGTASGELPTVSDGTELQIEFKWDLANGDNINHFVVDLASRVQNIAIVDVGSQTLTKDSEEVGTYTINNGILEVLFSSGTSFITGDERYGGLKIRGTINIDDSVGPTDTTIPIKIDNINKVLPYKNKAYVDLQKNLSGDITFINGEMYQTYEVTMTSKDGEVLINEFLDTPGNKLNSVSDVTIVENTATELTGLTVSSSYTMSELQAALQNKKLDEGEVLRFQYRYKIDNSAYEDGTVDSAYTNTAAVKYNDLPDPVTDTAMPEINKPTIEKTSGELVEQAGKKGFEWTISIKLNDFKTVDLSQLAIQLSDTLGAGLVNQGATNAIDFNDFTYNATTDVYEYKYFTEITQEYADSVSRKEATNEVTMTLKHPITGVPYTYENTGTGVVPGRNWINKTASSYDSASRTVTWEIKLENIPAGIRSVRVYDTVYNGLDITNTTIRVKDPNGVEKLLCENGVAVDNEFGYLDSISAANNKAIVKLYDDFVNNNAGKDVYIYVTSKLPDVITDAYNQSTFVNIA